MIGSPGAFIPRYADSESLQILFGDFKELSDDSVQHDTGKCFSGLGFIVVCHRDLLMTSHLLCQSLLAP